MDWPRQFFAGWRGLGRFWLLVATLLTMAGALLLLTGAPAPQMPPRVAAEQHLQAPQEAGRPTSIAPAQRPGRDTPGPIADPDPTLLDAPPGAGADLLPRIAPDGRMPMQVYAAAFDSTSRRPKVGLLLAGLGLNRADSELAIRTLPGGITLAFSPYAQSIAKLLSAARSAQHEYLVSIPMEPQQFPLNDPGRQALMTNLSPEQNRPRLDWILSRFAGYAGATGVEAGLLGERFASLADEMNPMLAELARRGLLYIDPRPRAAPLPSVWSRSVDIIVDEPATAPEIDDKLARLTRLAREKGQALGLAGTVRPVTTQRLAAWASGLMLDGIALAPVSALVQAPAR